MKALKLITLERVADASAIVCNVALASAALILCVVLIGDLLGHFEALRGVEQTVLDCARSL